MVLAAGIQTYEIKDTRYTWEGIYDDTERKSIPLIEYFEKNNEKYKEKINSDASPGVKDLYEKFNKLSNSRSIIIKNIQKKYQKPLGVLGLYLIGEKGNNKSSYTHGFNESDLEKQNIVQLW